LHPVDGTDVRGLGRRSDRGGDRRRGGHARGAPLLPDRAFGAHDRPPTGCPATPAGAAPGDDREARNARACGPRAGRHAAGEAVALSAERSPESGDARCSRRKKDRILMAEPASAARLAPLRASPTGAPAAHLSRRRNVGVWALVVVASLLAVISILTIW